MTKDGKKSRLMAAVASVNAERSHIARAKKECAEIASHQVVDLDDARFATERLRRAERQWRVMIENLQIVIGLPVTDADDEATSPRP